MIAQLIKHILLRKKKKFKLIYKRHLRNKGLSIALETGFNILKKLKNEDLVITMDSDNTHPISIIPKMINKMKKLNLISSLLQDSYLIHK